MPLMQTSLTADALGPLHERLARANLTQSKIYSGDRPARQPVHTVYGGAHLFTPDTPAKLGAIARRSFAEYAPDPAALAAALDLEPAVAHAIHGRIAGKLAGEAIEDYRIDFEDGYGNRPDAEEDGHAGQAARAVAAGLAAGTLPAGLGLRIKPLGEDLRARSLRTLDRFLTGLAREAGSLVPPRLAVTLPKVTSVEQVAVLVEVIGRLETILGWPDGAIAIELMVETPRAIFDESGRVALPALVRAAGARCTSVHFGPYDYTASLGVTAAHQRTDHPACDFAREVMRVSLAGTGLWLVDGPTTIMPIAPHRPAAGQPLTTAQTADNRRIVHYAWKRHYDHVRRGLANALYQGWDLHPAQLPARYAAVYAFFHEGLDQASARLRAFIDRSAQATRVGDVFDDAATGQGLLNYFLRAVGCGAITEAEALAQGGLTLPALQSRSFLAILRMREEGAAPR
jgi:hypothetical protein